MKRSMRVSSGFPLSWCDESARDEAGRLVGPARCIGRSIYGKDVGKAEYAIQAIDEDYLGLFRVWSGEPYLVARFRTEGYTAWHDNNRARCVQLAEGMESDHWNMKASLLEVEGDDVAELDVAALTEKYMAHG